MTISKIGMPVQDSQRAFDAAKYALDVSESPDAYARPDGRSEAAAGYYVDGGGEEGEIKARSMWVGSADALKKYGLTHGQEATVEELGAALRGQDLEGNAVREPANIKVPVFDARGRFAREDGKLLKQEVRGINSFDLTFQAPKTVSVLWSQAGNEQRAELERYMMDSAKVALDHVLLTRRHISRRIDGAVVTEKPIGYVASLSLHVTARQAAHEQAPSPHLHVHCTVVAAERSDGELVAFGNSQELYKWGGMLQAGAVGRAELADLMVEGGYEIEPDSGRHERFFEVKHVSRPLTERMKARHGEVKQREAEKILELGHDLTRAERRLLALETRAPKGEVSPDVTAGVWSALGEEYEWGLEEAAAAKAGAGYDDDLERRRAEVVAGVMRRIEKQGPVVPRDYILAFAHEAGQGRLSRGQIRSVVEELERSGQIVALQGRMATSRSIRDRELRVMNVAETRARSQAAPISERGRAAGEAAANARLGAGRALHREQKDALEVLTRGSGWSILTGRAGTGKGPVLRAVAEAHRTDGWQVIGCATDGTIAEQLGGDIAPVAGSNPARETTHCSITMFLTKAQHALVTLDDKTLLIVEEASKVGLRQWYEIALLCERSKMRVLCVGHEGQLGAIDLPGMFSAMIGARWAKPFELQQVRRHLDPNDDTKSHPWLGEYADAINDGDGKAALKLLRDNDAITMYRTRAEAMVGLVRSWEQKRNTTRARRSMMIIHGSNQDVDRVNELAQQRRIELDEIRGESVEANDRSYRIHRGEPVILASRAYHDDLSSRGSRVENGTFGTVTDVDQERGAVTVLFKSAKGDQSVVVDLNELREQSRGGDPGAPSLRLAYASHVYPTQGASIDVVGELGGHWSQGKEASYVAASRSIYEFHAHTDRESLGKHLTEEQAWERYEQLLETASDRTATLELAEIDARFSVEYFPREALPARGTPGLMRAGNSETTDIETSSDAVREPEPDPLAALLPVLGEERAAWLDERADERQQEVGELTVEELIVHRALTSQSIDALDRAAARESLSLERDASALEQRISDARAQAGELEAQVRDTWGVRQRHERRRVVERVSVLHRSAMADEEQLMALVREQQQLQDDGRHLDSWMATHGERASQWLAYQRELSERGLSTSGPGPEIGEQRQIDAPDIGAEPVHPDAMALQSG